FSLWSAVGLSCAIALGWETFDSLLTGAAAMDRHFTEAPLARNAPVLMALADIWNVNGLGRTARAVIPYASRLARPPAFRQQPGANAQHAFFQMLHQGTRVVPVDFIAVAGDAGLLTNAIAQAEALLVGKTVQAAAAELEAAGTAPDQIRALAPQKAFAGNRPS